jgi:uncharacterized protein YdeI (YjbR/CyaY-like superfamily)
VSAAATFFCSAGEFRGWLEQHHVTARELWVGFYKKSAGKSGLTYQEAVDEALCFGWIDGIVKRIDDERFMHRFTPRKPSSIWSNTNVRHVERLTAAGKMHAAGLAAFAARTAARTGVYVFEAKEAKTLSPAQVKAFRAHPAAWAFFQAQPPWYQRKVTWWVASAKQPATRERRLAQLIVACAAGKRR